MKSSPPTVSTSETSKSAARLLNDVAGLADTTARRMPSAGRIATSCSVTCQGRLLSSTSHGASPLRNSSIPSACRTRARGSVARSTAIVRDRSRPASGRIPAAPQRPSRPRRRSRPPDPFAGCQRQRQFSGALSGWSGNTGRCRSARTRPTRQVSSDRRPVHDAGPSSKPSSSAPALVKLGGGWATDSALSVARIRRAVRFDAT